MTESVESGAGTAAAPRQRNRRRYLALILVPPLAAGAVSATVALRADDAVVARTENISLLQSDVLALVQELDGPARAQLLRDTSALAALLRRELGRRELQQRALDEGWDRRDEVKARLERLRLDYLASSYLAAQVEPPTSFPSEAEIETAYQLNQQRFLSPRQFHLAQIYLRRPIDAAQVEAARGRAKALADELRKDPRRFADTARARSEDAASAPRGGELGWLAEDQIQPAIRAVAIGLAAGDVSEAIEAADGWHILRLNETKPAAVAPLAQVRDALAAMLRQQRAQENAAAYVTRLLAEKQAAVDEITLVKAQQAMR